ncbi:hypothetical protein NAEGRDRAFT_80703 [Naegleria gruberi]|uniref:Uncharacterized protein n=1 Tax=Naegleria gruberi TaxID=5762 RepID=D2VP34_NAEGR|nr:uncharacterized protein NAEGRDRAFT_80703 [Naegleria gruberi]EFC41363.1 hypothetical protein NAEGRDRAFT_80703 [Naegleria gruberi]|eukprot:XP_002674107.1 hypothetical protein NAEGRDRAFT_80703 [Naegleria gruberi strain NEG-M]
MNTQQQVYITETILDEGDIDMFDVPITSPTNNHVDLQIQQQRKEETSSYDFKDIIMEHGLPRIQPLSTTYDDLCESEKDFAARSFQVLANCARVKINRLLKLGGIDKRSYVGCGSVELGVFQVMFQSMLGATFFHSDRTVTRHGIKYKVPCIGYRFTSHLPVLDIFDNWGQQVITSATQIEDNYIVTQYLLQVKNISFIFDTESGEVTMHFAYDTKIKYDDEDEFHFF